MLKHTDRTSYELRIRALSAFGHRGSATPHEQRAADYLMQELRQMGLEPAAEAFVGSQSAGAGLLMHVVIASVGIALLWHFPAATVVLAGIALASMWAEQETRGVWLSWLQVRFASLNVSARVPAAGATRLRVVLCGHYDTQRTGAIWSLTALMNPLYWRLPTILKPPLLPIGLAFAGQVLLGLAAVWGGADGLVTGAGWFLLVVYAFFGVLFGEYAVAPFVPGAADNASGAAAVLSLAEAWKRCPVEDVELVVLLTSCEETGLLGAASWADRHRAAVGSVPTLFLNLDGLGFGPPRLLGWEVPGLGRPIRYPRALLDLALTTASDEGLQEVGPYALPGPTDGLALLTRGLPGLTLIGCQEEGRLPHYHRPSDLPDTVDYASAWQGVAFAWALLRRMASREPHSGAAPPCGGAEVPKN